MSTNKNTNETAIMAALQSNNSGSPSSAQDRLAALLEAKFAIEIKEERERKEQAETARLASVQAAKLAAAQKEASQDACPHMKPNFASALGGQKDHKGNFHYLCQYCQKEFGNNVPPQLRIPAEHVGGPQF